MSAATRARPPWVASAPSHWRIERLKNTVTACKNGVWGDEPDGQHDIVCVRVADFDRTRRRVRLENPTLRGISSTKRAGKVLRRGDLLIEKSGGGELQPVGTVVLYDHETEAVCSNFVARMPVAAGYDPGFLVYLHNALYGLRVAERSTKQTTGIQNLDSDEYLNEEAALPPLHEQRAIADYLDRKTAAIDALIAKKQRLLSLSQTRRATLVTHAVTKGLDDTVRLRESGAPAIGKIPAHWTHTRLKFVCSRIVDGVHSTPAYLPAGVPFVTVKNLTCGAGISLDDLNYISAEDHIEFCKRAHPERGDVLVTKDGTLGVCRVVETDTPFSIFVSVALLKPRHNQLNPYFLRYGLESSFVNQQLESRRLGSALKHIHLEDLADLYFPLPPLHEQHRIAEHVRSVAQHEEQLAKALASSITALREYRQALITAAVTGQLDLAARSQEAA